MDYLRTIHFPRWPGVSSSYASGAGKASASGPGGALPAISIALILVLFSPLASLESLAEPRPVCSECGKKIPSGAQYLSSEERTFCGQKCYMKTLPGCSICGKKTFKMIKNDQGALFCSQECISKTYPVCRGCQKRSQGGIVINGENDKFFCDGCAKKPRCFCCDLPADCSSLGDGRPICPECAKTSVKSDDEFLSLVKEVRGRMDKDLGLSTPHDIKYRMVDLPTLEKITPGQSSRMELGAFKEEETVETTIRRSSSLAFWKEAKEEREEKRSTSYKLFVLSEMSRAKMIEVAAHELAHDWMSCHYPDIENPAIVEGWAEFVAWRVNKLYGNGNLNPRIENNLDETYGGGFRTFRKAFVSGGDSAVMELLGKSPVKNR